MTRWPAIALCALLAPALLRAAAPTNAAAGPAAAPALSAARLDAAIDDVLDRPEYAWRLPRESNAEDETSPWALFFRGLARRVGDATDAALQALRKLMRRLDRWLNRVFGERDDARGSDADLGWLTSAQTLLFALLALSASALGILLWRRWRQKRAPAVPAAAASPVVDLAAEEVDVRRLPADEWLALAQRLAAADDYRLAMRALFLAGLAHLGHAGRLALNRAKSNREYARELERKAHDQGALLEAFAQNLGQFEGAWYGRHAVTAADLVRHEARLRSILAGDGPPGAGGAARGGRP